jgi:hypothetical protein
VRELRLMVGRLGGADKATADLINTGQDRP